MRNITDYFFIVMFDVRICRGRREGTEKEKLIYSSSTPSLSDLTFNNCTTWNPGDRSSTNSDFYESSTESILEEERDDLKQVSLCEVSFNFHG